MARQIKRASQKVGGLARYTDQRLNCGSAEALTHAVTGFLTPETRFWRSFQGASDCLKRK